MAILIEPPANWTNLQGKPAILSDNAIAWSEIINKPANLTFLAETIPGNWQPWVLSSYYGQRLEWMPLTSTSNPWTMVQRDGSGRIVAANFIATAIPNSSSGLSTGNFYKDSNGFVRIV